MLSAVPYVPGKNLPYTPSKSLKVASPDLIVTSEKMSVPVDIMTELLFEEIGGQEIINISRSDLISGQSVAYSPIKKLSILDVQYDTNILLGLQKTSFSNFANYSIKLDSNIPSPIIDTYTDLVYFDQELNAIVINIINVSSTEKVEVQIVSSGNAFNDTIYPGA